MGINRDNAFDRMLRDEAEGITRKTAAAVGRKKPKHTKPRNSMVAPRRRQHAPMRACDVCGHGHRGAFLTCKRCYGAGVSLDKELGKIIGQ